MCKTVKAIVLCLYCIVFLHSLIFLLLTTSEDIVEINYLIKKPSSQRKIMKEIKKNRKKSTVITMDFKRPIRLPGDYKFILNWNDDSSFSGSDFAIGQKSFLDYNCTYNNCYATNDKSLLLDIRHFDAILFDVESDWAEHPPLRIPQQKYIFSASESAANYPICHPNFDDFYNLTWTYKLDSNITKSPITIYDKSGAIVGPRVNMTWETPMLPITDLVKRKIKGKRKAAVWFSSNCGSPNSIESLSYVHQLNNSLIKANLTLDVFGWCVKQSCPRDRIEECLVLLKKDYFFYLAFESVISEDYVSEEILYAMLNFAVPIVYGGANYTRFLPPGSYIDARQLSPKKIVAVIKRAIKHPDIYNDYFRWRNHYTFKEASKYSGICDLCKSLNEETSDNNIITNFREWWNSNYKQLCQ